MNQKTREELDLIGQRLEAARAGLLDEVLPAIEAVSVELQDSQVVEWAERGAVMAEQSVRSWEAAARYFAVSPAVARMMPFNYFLKWADCGSELCAESPTLAVSYFAASPGAMSRLRSRHIETWMNLGRGLYKGSWKSSTLSTKFFEASPNLLTTLTVPELERFTAFLGALSNRSYDMAAECLAASQEIFPLLGEDKRTFIRLGMSLTESTWRQVKGLFESSARALPNIQADQRTRFIRLAQGLHDAGTVNLPAAISAAGQALGQIETEHHEPIVGMAESLMKKAPEAVPSFIDSCPRALQKVSITQLTQWFNEGEAILDHNEDGGLAYFRIESSRSHEALETLSSSVEFSRVRDVMEMYCRALAGTEIKLSTSNDLAEKNIGWVSDEAPTTEGSTVFLPAQEGRYGTKQENFALYKVISTHQTAHLEFGSFRFRYDLPSALFDDLRPQVDPATRTRGDGQEPQGSEGWVTDMQRFFDIFDERRLALDVFTIVEDGRLDAIVVAEYPGISISYLAVQEGALESRPEIKSLPAREALVELLVRISLRQKKSLAVPSQYREEAHQVVALARRAAVPTATVEDAAEATLRIYAILSQIPNEEAAPDDWQDIELPDTEGADAGLDETQLVDQLMQDAESEESEEGEEEYNTSEDVDYRGEFKPELAQMMTELRMQRQGDSADMEGEQITQEMLEEMLKSSAEVELDAGEGGMEEATGAFADNMLKEAGLTLPQTPEMGQGPLMHVDDQGGSLDPDEPQSFVYDEWDFRADDYKPNWCIVRQKKMAEGDASYFGSTLHSYGPLADQIRRQFEMLVPEMFRKVRKLEDGEEIDIDDVIEAIVDIRTGAGPSEKLYWKRNKVQRDVAVVFLLDTSASTAEAIEDSKNVTDDWDAPSDPVEYMVWLRTRRGDGMRRSYKRIIDLEKEAIVLLIHALEAIGDVYGIYSFSGYGRENVEFYTIKDIDENFSDRVQRRIDRIAPLHATRMGPAIRHATMKLDEQDARTKLLFLISDGRPQDRGYSREGVEKEYAVHDTRMALDEARDKNISAFCLTVDKNGHDYLKTMCADMGYEVLDDIHSLPNRLLYLYRRLTI